LYFFYTLNRVSLKFHLNRLNFWIPPQTTAKIAWNKWCLIKYETDQVALYLWISERLFIDGEYEQWLLTKIMYMQCRSPSFGSHFMRSCYLLLSVKQNKTNGYPGMEKFSINTEYVIPKQNSYVNFAFHWLANKIDFLICVSRRVLKITKQIHCWSRKNKINHFWLYHKMSYYDRIKSIRHLYETPLVYIVFLYITLTRLLSNIKYVSSTADPLIDIITHNMVVINTRF
jgi:hypothetical protein